MRISDRKQIAKEVQTRLNAGERKEAIYNAMKDDYYAPGVERSLAQWAYPEDKEKNRSLNIPLLIIGIVFALTTIIRFLGVFQALELSQIVAGFLTIVIHLYIIYGIKTYNLLGYFLIILVSIGTLLSLRTTPIGAGNILPVALAAAAIVLAWIQKRRLFPNVSFLLRHKKDSDRNIIF